MTPCPWTIEILDMLLVTVREAKNQAARLGYLGVGGCVSRDISPSDFLLEGVTFNPDPMLPKLSARVQIQETPFEGSSAAREFPSFPPFGKS